MKTDPQADPDKRFIIKNRLAQSDENSPPSLAEASDKRLHVPATLRNGAPLADILKYYTNLITQHQAQKHSDSPKAPPESSTNILLELGSGSGEHAAHIAPQLGAEWLWQPSDPEPEHRSSIDAWAQTLLPASASHLRPARFLDIAQKPWPLDDIKPAIMLIFAANVLHVSPPSLVTSLLEGAGLTLNDGGFLILYGPFKEGEQPLSPSNIAFDESLKARNPHWGIRNSFEIERIASQNGLALYSKIPMPSNNLCLIYQKQALPNQ